MPVVWIDCDMGLNVLNLSVCVADAALHGMFILAGGGWTLRGQASQSLSKTALRRPRLSGTALLYNEELFCNIMAYRLVCVNAQSWNKRINYRSRMLSPQEAANTAHATPSKTDEYLLPLSKKVSETPSTMWPLNSEEMVMVPKIGRLRFIQSGLPNSLPNKESKTLFLLIRNFE